MAKAKYGVEYKNPAYGWTGAITDCPVLAHAYAKRVGGTVYKIGSEADPETRQINSGD